MLTVMISLDELRSMPTPQRIGRRIVAIRSARKITQKQLAEMAGISNKTLNQIENGSTDCRLSIIGKIEQVLEATLILVPNEDLI